MRAGGERVKKGSKGAGTKDLSPEGFPLFPPVCMRVESLEVTASWIFILT